jgi:hypothetical protein
VDVAALIGKACGAFQDLECAIETLAAAFDAFDVDGVPHKLRAIARGLADDVERVADAASDLGAIEDLEVA